MPLSSSQSRRQVGRRTISCEGYAREDGLLDVDGVLVDTSCGQVDNPERGRIVPGTPIHDMHVRLTVDEQCVIRAIEAAMDATPFAYCTSAAPNLQRLVGVKISGGFRKIVQERVGHTEGCTHLVTLLGVMSTAAIRTVAESRRHEGRAALADIFATRGPSRHPLLNTCRSYAADSPVTRQLWPEHVAAPPEKKP